MTVPWVENTHPHENARRGENTGKRRGNKNGSFPYQKKQQGQPPPNMQGGKKGTKNGKSGGVGKKDSQVLNRGGGDTVKKVYSGRKNVLIHQKKKTS